MRRSGVFLAALALLAGACSGVEQPRERVVALDGEPMEPCSSNGTRAFCGRLAVPEDRSDPSSRTIELSVVVIPASTPAPADDPVFFITGGPGDASTEAWASAATAFPSVHHGRDIVLVDQRGTGDSNQLVFPHAPDLSGMSGAEAGAVLSRWFRGVLEDLGGDPRFYTSADAADDLDDVRAAIGYERIDVYGISYGATLAQEYARRHADHTRAVVLDSGTLLDLPLVATIPRRSEEALDSVFARCAADPACHASFPDPAADLATATRRLASHPVTQEVHGEEIVLDTGMLAATVHELLKTGRSGLLPDLLDEVAKGDTAEVANLAASLAAQPDPSRLVVYWATMCVEPWAAMNRDLVADLGEGSYLLPNYLEESRSWALGCGVYRSVTGAASAGGDPLVSDLPVLLMNSDEDPQDPPANVADAPVELPNSLVVRVPGQGHGVGFLGCLPDVVAAFLEAGSVDGLDVECVADLEPQAFADVDRG
jgi:pimeloyl-ACP methyl ester carboxylesterase